jgi:hypothetical protein
MIKVSDQILFQKLGNEAVILHLHSEEYFGLDEVGTKIWEVLVETGSIDAALPVLLNEFDTEETILKKDMEELVHNLKAEKILEDV